MVNDLLAHEAEFPILGLNAALAQTMSLSLW